MSKQARQPEPVYRANDGSIHSSAAAAGRRNELLKARSTFEAAAEEVKLCLGEAGLTADGEPLEMRRVRDYWYIAHTHGGLPRLMSLYFWPHNAMVDDSPIASLVVRVFDEDRRAYQTFNVRDLYASKDKAVEALCIACEEQLQYLIDQAKQTIERAQTC